MDLYSPLIKSLLPALLIVFAFVAAAEVLKALFSKPAEFPYEKIGPVYTPAERSLLGVLEQILHPSHTRVIGKVRVADLLRTERGLSASRRQAAFNRISQKHVDFILCDPSTWEVIGVIELDDSSHSRADRQRCDRFLEGAFAAANVPLIRIPAQNGYRPEEVRQRLAEGLASRR
jgi:hypothetical protein